MSDQDDIVAGPARRFFGAWLDASAEFASGVLRANRALLSATGPEQAAEPDEEAAVKPGRPGVAYTEQGWEVETSFASDGRVSVGDEVRFSKVLTEEDVAAFATASGDTNRLHLDDEFADDTRFGGTIVHGTLVSGLVSAALARLPGLVIYISQDTSFVGPVETGQRATAVVEVLEDLGNGQFRLSTEVLGDDETAVEGEAVVLVEEMPGD